MSKDIDPNDPTEWISCAEAVTMLSCGQAQETAVAALSIRASKGKIRTLAEQSTRKTLKHGLWTWSSDDDVPAPASVFVAPNEPASESNWFTGDFHRKFKTMFEENEVWVIGVKFARRDVEELARLLPEPKMSAVSAPPAPRGGRSVGNRWADLAEELAVQIYLHGIPEGQGTRGQAEVVNRVLDAMARQDKVGPGTTTVKPIVGKILLRLRSDKN